jgi:hypothetical protein
MTTRAPFAVFNPNDAASSGVISWICTRGSSSRSGVTARHKN